MPRGKIKITTISRLTEPQQSNPADNRIQDDREKWNTPWQEMLHPKALGTQGQHAAMTWGTQGLHKHEQNISNSKLQRIRVVVSLPFNISNKFNFRNLFSGMCFNKTKANQKKKKESRMTKDMKAHLAEEDRWTQRTKSTD